MKKPILIGPKLIAVGPLKCFKGGGGGSSGGGGGSRGGGGKGGGGGSSSRSSSSSKGGGSSSGGSPKPKPAPKPKEEEKSEGYGGPSLGFGDDKTGSDEPGGTPTVSSGDGGGFKPGKKEKSGLAGFMDKITGGDAAEAKRLGMTTEEYKQAKDDAGEGTGLFGQTTEDIKSAKKARESGEIRDAAPISDEVLKEAEVRAKAKKDLEERNKALSEKALEAERSPFAKQLAGVDVDKAVEAQEQRRIGEETSGFGRRLAKEMDLGQEIEDQAMLREAEEDVRMAKEVSPFSKQVSPDMIQKMQQEQQDALDAGESLRQFRIREQEAKEQDTEDRELKEGAESERREDLAAQKVEEAKRFEEQLASDPRFGSLEEFKEAKLQKDIADRRQARMDEENIGEQSSFGEQLKDEGFDFQKAIADRALSQDLERQDEIRRKDARERALLEKEASPFSKQLEGVDIEAAEAAEFDRYKEKAKAERAERKRLEADPRFGSPEEFEAFKDQQEEESKKIRSDKLYSDWEKSVRDKQAEMDRKKGDKYLTKEEYESFTGKEDVGPGVKTRIVDGVKTKVVETAEGKILDTAGNLINMIPGVGLVNSLSKMVGGPDLVKKALQKTGVEGAVKSGVKGAVDEVSGEEILTPTSFQEAVEARAEEAEMVTKPAPKPKRGGDAGKALALGLGAAAAAKALQPKDKPAEPAPAAEPAKGEATDVEGKKKKLMEDLEKQASGEESLAEKQVRRTQDRSLAQRLAALKSMRGQDAGTKLRSFSKASDRARREAEGQIEIAGMKERRSAQDQLRAQLNKMSDDEMRERWRKIDRDDRQRLMKMNREDAIKRGEFNKWLTVIAMGQKLFPDQIKAAGGFIGDNVLSPVWEGGKKIVSGVGDFIGDVFSAEGGYISGPGTETSDSIPARLSDGEFVVKASAVRGLGKELGAKGKGEEREKGVDFLYNLQDKMDKKAEGGEVSKFDQEHNLADQKRKMFMNYLKKKNIPYNQKERNFFNEWGKGEPRESIEDFKETYESYYAKGGEAYVRPKKAFREAIGYEPESRFHDKAEKNAKHGGARRKFRHFQQGGAVSLGVKGLKPQFNVPQSQGYGSVIAAQKDLDRRLAELERQLGR